MSTPERPDRGDAPRERRSGLERRISKGVLDWRTPGFHAELRRFGSDRRRSPEDAPSADWPTVHHHAGGGYVWTSCVECGPDVEVDEDGCCVTCGSDATYYGRSPEDVRPEPMAAVGEIAAPTRHEPDPEPANFPDYDDAFLAMVNDMDVVPEDVRGADVGEARELLLDMLADVCTNVHVHDYGALPGGIDLGKHADRILAALRSPEPAAEPVAWLSWHWAEDRTHGEPGALYLKTEKERAKREAAASAERWAIEVELVPLYTHPPSAEPATGRDRSQGVPEQEVPSAGGELRYTLAEVAEMMHGESRRIGRLRSVVDTGGAWPLEGHLHEAARWLRSRGATTETGDP